MLCVLYLFVFLFDCGRNLLCVGEGRRFDKGYLLLVDAVEEIRYHVSYISLYSTLGGMILACLLEEEEPPRDSFNG